ncbi:serine hydrolase domain-containing protein [Curtobacterium sp. SP.BCp]|uniref:serine hydrolase domain-containing protein n=1 Tax=Curtobacterium sp. SP.BCp TaxID=3435230 RepID=UPI003F7414EA
MDDDVAPQPAWSGTMLVARGAEPLVERAVGNTAGPESPPIILGTRFQAGSISKQLMSVVALDLVARGRLALDQPIAEHLPALPGHLRAVTLHHLLSHTSGLGHWSSLDGVPPLLDVPSSHEELVRLTLTAEPDAAPGERFRYSGPGFLVVARVIEAVTGRPYAEALGDVVLGPTGMRDTTSGQFPERGAAVGHVDGRTITVEQGFADLPGTGDLWTTAGDLLRYGRALRSGQLIPQTLVAEMLSPQAILEPPDPVDRSLSAKAYGYGTFLGRVLGDDGWFVPGDNPGFQSLLAEVPGEDTEVVVLSNDASGVEAALHEWAATR